MEEKNLMTSVFKNIRIINSTYENMFATGKDIT